jgi:hypothetical protein
MAKPVIPMSEIPMLNVPRCRAASAAKPIAIVTTAATA